MNRISSQMDEILAQEDMETRDRLLPDVFIVMEAHERVESICVLELWLWKMKMVAAEASEGDSILLDRESCRAKCGASFAVPIVIAFLGYGWTSTTS